MLPSNVSGFNRRSKSAVNKLWNLIEPREWRILGWNGWPHGSGETNPRSVRVDSRGLGVRSLVVGALRRARAVHEPGREEKRRRRPRKDSEGRRRGPGEGSEDRRRGPREDSEDIRNDKWHSNLFAHRGERAQEDGGRRNGHRARAHEGVRRR